MITESRETER
jgi:ATP-dependent RNA helicase DDX46/PRP5